MFFIRDGKWEIFPKKISYKEKKVVYDIDDTMYRNNPNNSEVVVTMVELTPEQIERFELIRNASECSISDIEKFVYHDVVNPLTENNLPEVIQAAKSRKRLESMVRWDEVTEEEIADLIDDFEEYRVPSNYFAGNIIRYENQLYKVLQAHLSHLDWTPKSTQALYQPIAPPGIIAEWKQPTGRHDAYNTGDKVTFGGKVYESLIDGNVWSPAVYPQGWKEIVV